jgi:hypothetical protein
MSLTKLPLGRNNSVMTSLFPPRESLVVTSRRGFSPNFQIHVSVNDLYISGISPHISCSRIGKPILGIYKSFTDTWMWKLGVGPSNSFSGNICVIFLVLCLCSEAEIKKRLYLRWPEVYQPKVFPPQQRVKWQKMPLQVGTRRLTTWRRRRKTSAGELVDKMSPLHRRNYLKKSHVYVVFVHLQNLLAITD